MFLGRREFLAGTVGAGAVLSGCASQSIGKSKTELWTKRAGVQLYTFKSMMEKNQPLTLKAVSAAGYKEVEFAGYFDTSLQEYKRILDGEGLTAPSTHLAYRLFVDKKKFDETIEAANVLGHKYIVVPHISPKERTSLDDYRRIAEDFTVAAEKCKAAGVQFAYHNHAFEFEEMEGQLPYDLLLSETDADLVKMELDLCWIYAAGYSAVDYMKAHPGRFPLFHVKDYNDAKEICPVGSGNVDFASIFAAADIGGLKHAFIEHDKAKDPVTSVTQSYNYLQKTKIQMPRIS